MSSGWGCQHLTTYKEEKEWCRLLKHKCGQDVMDVYCMVNFFSLKRIHRQMQRMREEKRKSVLIIR